MGVSVSGVQDVAPGILTWKKNGRGLVYLSYLRTGALYRSRYKSTSCQSGSRVVIPLGPPFSISIIVTLLTVLTADGETGVLTSGNRQRKEYINNVAYWKEVIIR
jgi:hypothetical protein